MVLETKKYLTSVRFGPHRDDTWHSYREVPYDPETVKWTPRSRYSVDENTDPEEHETDVDGDFRRNPDFDGRPGSQPRGYRFDYVREDER